MNQDAPPGYLEMELYSANEKLCPHKMDPARGTQNHFKVRAPQPAHFDLQVEVRVSKKCPYYEGNTCGNQEKRSPETDVHIQTGSVQEDLALHSSSVKATCL